jgi:thymidylate synthase (FAD)
MILTKPSFEIVTNVGLHFLNRIEEAGRTCYKSEDLITTTSAMEFVKKILKRGHESVIEHCSISVRFIIDRGVSHELVRHRLCAFSQESTRYCNYKGGVTFVIPPWVNIRPEEYVETTFSPLHRQYTPAEIYWFNQLIGAEKSYLKLLSEGWLPQQARSVLPNSLKTEIVVTANLREWRHIFKLRCAPAAHPQMCEVMIPLRDELRKQVPVVFDEDNN